MEVFLVLVVFAIIVWLVVNTIKEHKAPSETVTETKSKLDQLVDEIRTIITVNLVGATQEQVEHAVDVVFLDDPIADYRKLQDYKVDDEKIRMFAPSVDSGKFESLEGVTFIVTQREKDLIQEKLYCNIEVRDER